MRSGFATLAAVAVVSAAGLATAPPAGADFGTQFRSECSGGDIAGQGASFQAPVQAAWIDGFKNGIPGLADPVCPQFGYETPHPSEITYSSTGSGAGLRAFGDEGSPRTSDRFAATDDPPHAGRLADMENGVPSDTGDDGELRTVPVVSGAITVSVNFPDGCTIPSGIRYRPNADGTTRFVVSNTDVEALWGGDYATWGDFIPDIGGAGCGDRALRRVVRSDVSGTTYMFKTWLRALNPERTDPSWALLRSPFYNTHWPADAGATAVVRGAGNGGVARGVRDTDGSVGYVDLATARNEGFDKTGRRSLPGGGDTTSSQDTTYWLPLQNGSGQFRDPTATTSSYREPFATAARGANCAQTEYRNIPGGFDPTFAVWSFVEGVDPPTGYGICLLTYVMAWEDHCDAYGPSTAEQAKARSVFDYLNFTLSPAGQTLARRNDYSPLPPEILRISTLSASVGAEPWRLPEGSCS